MLDLDRGHGLSLVFLIVSSIQGRLSGRVTSAGVTAFSPDLSSAPAPFGGVIRQLEAMASASIRIFLYYDYFFGNAL